MINKVLNNALNSMSQILAENKFIADDEVGWFFEKIKEIQEALNEFRLR